MTNDPITTPPVAPTTAEDGPDGASTVAVAQNTGPLASEHGSTSIADVVVSKIAGVATREVPGVHSLGAGAARALGAIRERIPGQKVSVAQGVSVEVGVRQAAVDLVVVVEYGFPIAQVAEAVRDNVIGSLEHLTGLEVTEVNITVADVHLPDDEDDETDDEPRVQ
jgi:uncharacterized alkaline shock family protein YloU